MLKVQQDMIKSHFELKVIVLQIMSAGLVSALAVIVGHRGTATVAPNPLARVSDFC